MYFSGTSDPLVPDGGGRSPSSGILYPPAAAVIDAWALNNGCDPIPEVSALPDLNTTDRSTVELSTYGSCDSYASTDEGMQVEATVSLYRIVGGGHRWPGGRSPGPVGQSFLAPTNFDINASQLIWEFFSQHSVPRRIGDANLDGIFDSGDMVSVFQAGEYEDDVARNSSWETGDWNGDGEFDSGDLVVAFQDGGYEQGARSAVNAVPEPSSATMLAIGVLALYRRRPSR